MRSDSMAGTAQVPSATGRGAGCHLIEEAVVGASLGDRWPGGIIPYVVVPEFVGVDVLNDAMTAWEEVSNLRFVRRLSVQSDYIEVRHAAERCHSAVGYGSGARELSCAPADFDKSSLIHELGHAAGLKHEHQRSDRQLYVRVLWDNVLDSAKGNFRLEANTRNSPTYDFASIMHYRDDGFSKNGQPTLAPLVAGTTLNWSSLPTQLDLDWMNTEYPHLGVVRRSDSATGAQGVGELACAPRLGSGTELITAVQALDGSLKLIYWRITGDGGVVRVADSASAAGAATQISITRAPNRNTFVTAVRSGSGRVRLIGWTTEDNKVQRLGTKDDPDLAGRASHMTVAAVTDDRFVTACRNDSGRLFLFSARLNANGSLTRLSDSGNLGTNDIDAVAMIRVGDAGDMLFATTVTMASGRVRVLVWHVDALTGGITLRGHSGDMLGFGSMVATAVTPSGHLLVSRKNRSGSLFVVSLSVTLGGTVLVRNHDSGQLAGGIERNSIVARPYGAVSAVATTANRLKLIKWQVDSGGRLSRIGDSGNQVGVIDAVQIAETPGAAHAPLITAVRNASGSLVLLSWDDVSANGELQ